MHCRALTDLELSERLEKMGTRAFWGFEGLQRIAIPLKRDIFSFDISCQKYNQFDRCQQLTTVDLVGGDSQNRCLFAHGELEGRNGRKN